MDINAFYITRTTLLRIVSFTLIFIVLIIEPCEYGNKTYHMNQSYMTWDCKERCTCKFFNGAAKPKCEALCPTPNDFLCRNDTQEIEEYQEPVTGSNCSCPAKRCIRGLKLFRGNQRNVFFEKEIQDLKTPR